MTILWYAGSMTKPPPIWIRDANVFMPVEYHEKNFTLTVFHNKNMALLHYPKTMRVAN